MTALLERLAPLILSMLRAVSGLIFMVHGAQKLIGYPPTDRVTETFSLSWWAGVIELVAGFFIAIGFQTRASAFISSGTMAVAYWVVHAPISRYPAVNGGDAAVLFCFVFFYIFFAGGGPVGIDAMRRRSKARAATKATAAQPPSPAPQPAKGAAD